MRKDSINNKKNIIVIGVLIAFAIIICVIVHSIGNNQKNEIVKTNNSIKI